MARKAAGIALIIAIPVARYGVDFVAGYTRLSFGLAFSSGLLLLFPIPALAAFILSGWFVANRLWLRFVVGAGMFATAFALTAFAIPPSTVTYSDGLRAFVVRRVDVRALQAWAAEKLEEYERGELLPGEEREMPEALEEPRLTPLKAARFSIWPDQPGSAVDVWMDGGICGVLIGRPGWEASNRISRFVYLKKAGDGIFVYFRFK